MFCASTEASARCFEGLVYSGKTEGPKPKINGYIMAFILHRLLNCLISWGLKIVVKDFSALFRDAFTNHSIFDTDLWQVSLVAWQDRVFVG